MFDESIPLYDKNGILQDNNLYEIFSATIPGHADAGTTMDIYADATKELKKAELKIE